MRTLSYNEAMAATVNTRVMTLSQDLKQNFSGYIPEIFFSMLSVIDVVRAYKFQVHTTALVIISLVAVQPYQVGLAFLAKVPKQFTCEQYSSNKMSNDLMSHKRSWKSCTQDEICAEGLDKSKFKGNESDPEYFNNWIQKLDILCTPQTEIGFIGSSFFLGVILCILFIPSLADSVGRRPILKMTYVVQFISLLGFVFVTNIKVTIFFMFVLGFSHPGKNIVAFNYTLEQLPVHSRNQVVCLFRAIESGWIIVIAFFYQYVDRSYKTLEFCSLGITAVTIFVVNFWFYESPKYYHTVKKYKECRQALKKIAEYNGNTEYSTNFVFIEEGDPSSPIQIIAAVATDQTGNRRLSITNSAINKKEEFDARFQKNESSTTASECEEGSILLEQGYQSHQNTSDRKLEKSLLSGKDDSKEVLSSSITSKEVLNTSQSHVTPVPRITESQYQFNIMKMTVMWCAVSFSVYLLMFMDKYLEGSIYNNSYAEGAAGIFAAIIGTRLYTKMGMRNMYLFSYSLTLLGGIIIFLLESERIQLPPYYLSSFVEGSITKTPKLRRLAVTKAVDYLVPKLAFISKFGLQLAFLCTYTASFSNDRIFPADRRTSAIGQCQLIGRTLTIFASEVTELPKPQPIFCLLIITVLAIIVSATFESGQQNDADELVEKAKEREFDQTLQSCNSSGSEQQHDRAIPTLKSKKQE